MTKTTVLCVETVVEEHVPHLILVGRIEHEGASVAYCVWDESLGINVLAHNEVLDLVAILEAWVVLHDSLRELSDSGAGVDGGRAEIDVG